MRDTIRPIVKKELKTYFNSPIACIVFVVFLTASADELRFLPRLFLLIPVSVHHRDSGADNAFVGGREENEVR